jgi:hypothetical protein
MTTMPILILDEHDPERELEFDLPHMLSLTTAERYRWMFANRPKDREDLKALLAIKKWKRGKEKRTRS